MSFMTMQGFGGATYKSAPGVGTGYPAPFGGGLVSTAGSTYPAAFTTGVVSVQDNAGYNLPYIEMGML